MKTASFNANPISSECKQVHTCNVCGSVQFWTDDHRHIERGVGSGAGAYEVHFITCSDACREKSKEFFIKWLGGQPGWSKKSAAENWEKYI